MPNNITKAGASKLSWGGWQRALGHAQLKLCEGPCGRPSDPASGVQVTPTKWYCGRCWAARLSRKNPALLSPPKAESKT